MKLPDSELRKEREILLAKFPPGQTERALDFLGRFQNLEARVVSARQVCVSYNLRDYSLHTLLDALEDAGFHLDDTLMSLLLRALAKYSEEVQLHNLEMPDRPIKKSDEAYVQAWEHHPHGDYDDTPPEWREYR